MRLSKNISITTGDVDGIGLEVTTKALSKVGPRPGYNFFLYRSPHAPRIQLRRLDSKFDRKLVSSAGEGLLFLKSLKRPSARIILDILDPRQPPLWAEESAQLCMKNDFRGIVTAPMSKSLIRKVGFKDIGHTDIFSRIAGAPSVRMGFIGDKFSVVLATGHIPIKEVCLALTLKNLKIAIGHAWALAKSRGDLRPLGLVGLNPHAGEDGLIGKEELGVFMSALAWAAGKKIPIVGPLSPDAAFLPFQWKNVSCYVASYHDQGLIPFKTIHGQDKGCHVSLGLPFVRTSVDHGTAKSLFGKNKANPRSMIEALQLAMTLLK